MVYGKGLVENMCKVSVLTPLYNTDPVQLREMIDSVLAQTYKDFELLLLNDSPDNRVLDEIIRGYSDSRIRYLRNERNLGISKSRNILIKEARGEYLAVCDHDDISLQNRFEKEVAFLDSHPEVGVVSGLCEVFGGGEHSFKSHPEHSFDIKLHLMRDCYLAHPAAMIRKSVLIENNIFYNEFYSPAEDYKLWADLLPLTEFYNIQEILIRYRSFDENTSVTQKQKMEDASIKIQLDLRNRFPAYFSELLKRESVKIKSYKLFGIIPLVTVYSDKICLFNIPIITVKNKL